MQKGGEPCEGRGTSERTVLILKGIAREEWHLSCAQEMWLWRERSEKGEYFNYKGVSMAVGIPE